MKLRILPDAESDIGIAADFYESQSAGLGNFFISSIVSDIESLRIYAGAHAKTHGFHRLICKRFPFAVYYLMDDQHVDIYAVLDCRQDPAKTDARLTNE